MLSRRNAVMGAGGLFAGVLLPTAYGDGGDAAAPSPEHRFHLPLTPETELWRQLVEVGSGEASLFPTIPAGLAEKLGTRVTLRGFLVPLEGHGPTRRFLISANPFGCPGCQSRIAGTVMKAESRQPIELTEAPVTVTGILRELPLARLPFRLDQVDLV